MPGAVALPITLTTALALIDQFSASLASPSTTTIIEVESPCTRSPLPLLSASAEALKAQTTKLSLLTLNAPFTPSAISTNLASLNDSVLPSLVTAVLLIVPATFPPSFGAEATSLAHAALADLKFLVKLVQLRSQDGKPKSEVSEKDKKALTEVTGKIWEDCDALVAFANGGLGQFIIHKATQWLDLMKDAVRELQGWDPEEEEDDEGLFSDEDEPGESSSQATKPNQPSTSSNSAIIKAGVKTEVLKVLTRIPQSIHVVVKQRLAKLPPLSSPTATPITMSPAHRSTIESILRRTRQISECIDESAENIYLGDLEGCLKKAGEARQLTIEVVESVVVPWQDGKEGREETNEDKYIKRALEWIRQVEPIPGVMNQTTQGTQNGT